MPEIGDECVKATESDAKTTETGSKANKSTTKTNKSTTENLVVDTWTRTGRKLKVDVGKQHTDTALLSASDIETLSQSKFSDLLEEHAAVGRILILACISSNSRSYFYLASLFLPLFYRSTPALDFPACCLLDFPACCLPLPGKCGPSLVRLQIRNPLTNTLVSPICPVSFYSLDTSLSSTLLLRAEYLGTDALLPDGLYAKIWINALDDYRLPLLPFKPKISPAPLAQQILEAQVPWEDEPEDQEILWLFVKLFFLSIFTTLVIWTLLFNFILLPPAAGEASFRMPPSWPIHVFSVNLSIGSGEKMEQSTEIVFATSFLANVSQRRALDALVSSTAFLDALPVKPSQPFALRRSGTAAEPSTIAKITIKILKPPATFTLTNLSADLLVSDLKRQLAERQGGVRDVKLILKGKALLNELRLSDYPALDGQTLHMMFKPAATGTESSAEASPAAPDQLMASLAARGADVSFWKDLYGWLETTGFNGDSAAAARILNVFSTAFSEQLKGAGQAEKVKKAAAGALA
ncbi:MAG: hypothetical protein SGCHY_000568 [Lobulomycetales sp.]